MFVLFMLQSMFYDAIAVRRNNITFSEIWSWLIQIEEINGLLFGLFSVSVCIKGVCWCYRLLSLTLLIQMLSAALSQTQKPQSTRPQWRKLPSRLLTRCFPYLSRDVSRWFSRTILENNYSVKWVKCDITTDNIGDNIKPNVSVKPTVTSNVATVK